MAIETRPVSERFPFTKFLPPVLDERVATDRLIELLEASVASRPLTVITAPAGSGKTTALAAWSHATASEVVWVRLGPDDNEPAVFAAALVEGGRRQVASHFGSRLAQLLAYAGSAPSPRQLAASLVNDLGDHGAVSLVLDDVHEIDDAAALTFLEELLDHLPPEVPVLLGSRVEPAVSMARRRVRGEVAEFGLDDLLLDRTAVMRVLAHEGTVSETQVDALLDASGGWAAAVRLSTAHLGEEGVRPRDIAGIAGPDVPPDLQRFLAEEVLDQLPESLRSFLLETSILEELSPDACAAVTGRRDCRQVLAEIDRRNLFLTRHPTSAGDTWRMHDLFAAFLRETLAATCPREHLTQLHLRAARVLPPLRALPHLLAAGAHDDAARLIVDVGFADLDTSSVLRLVPALRELPSTLRSADHRLAMLEVWAAHAAGEAHTVVGALEPVRDRLRAAADEGAAAEVNVVLAEAYLQLGDLERAGVAIDHALTHVHAGWRPVIWVVASWWSFYRDDWRGVSEHFVPAVEAALAAEEPWLRKSIAASMSPLLLFVAPGPDWVADAADRLASGLHEDDRATRTSMRSAQAGAALLRLDVDRAVDELDLALVESEGYGRLAWKHQEAECLRTAIALGAGDLATVQRIVDDALPRLDGPVYRQYLSVYVLAAMRLRWLAGEHREVVAICDRYLAAGVRIGHAEETVARAVADGMVARIEGRHEDALAVLRDGELAQREGRCWLWTGLPGLDRAGILLEQGRTAAAIEAALPTLEVAAEAGAGILFPDARLNRAVLERCVRAGVHVEMLRAVLTVSGPAASVGRPATIPGSDEVLSPREGEVLAQVATGASNREIAEALFISEVTVKSHLTRILRKLDASSRTQAVARARQLRLL
jgi:LuxR family transcriptional regulator, maltose regulon positive regulatory protein